MTMSERIFYFQSAVQARNEESDRQRRRALDRREAEFKDYEDQKRRIAEHEERDRVHALEERHAHALAFLRRLPFDQVPTTARELSAVVGHPFAKEGERPDRRIQDRLVSWILKERHVYDDGITYPDTLRLAEMLAAVDEVPEWTKYLSLPHVMLAEELHRRLTRFGRNGPPEHPNSRPSRR